MKSITLSIFSVLLWISLEAQDSTNQIIGFRLEKIKRLNDSIYEGHVFADQRFVKFRKGQAGLILRNKVNGDTGKIGMARFFKSINEQTQVFAIRTLQKQNVKVGDLLYLSITLERPLIHLTQSLAAKTIYLSDVYGDSLYKFLPVIFDWDEVQEEALLLRLTKDIQETGKAMKA